jgi:hypothetical protein
MTVRECIKKLERMDPNAIVVDYENEMGEYFICDQVEQNQVQEYDRFTTLDKAPKVGTLRVMIY